MPLKALNLTPGDEVITTAFTFFATAGTIHNTGGKPVFVDIDPDTFNILPSAIEAAITPRTKAIVVVHLFGQMAPMEAILPVAGKARTGGHRRRGPGHRREAPNRRHLADGWRAGHSDRLLLLPEQESRAPGETVE